MGWNDWIRTVEIAPALAGDPAEVAAQVEVLLRAGCRIFHIDGDLRLLERIAPIAHRGGGIVEISLPGGESLTEAIALGADSVTLAAPTPTAVEQLQTAGCQVGVIGAVLPPGVDLVSIAVEDSEASIGQVRELATAVSPGVRVQVVGDLGHGSVRAFHEAGATVIVVGPSIFEREDLPRAYRRLVQALA